jgi:hypothetical protein
VWLNRLAIVRWVVAHKMPSLFAAIVVGLAAAEMNDIGLRHAYYEFVEWPRIMERAELQRRLLESSHREAIERDRIARENRMGRREAAFRVLQPLMYTPYDLLTQPVDWSNPPPPGFAGLSVTKERCSDYQGDANAVLATRNSVYANVLHELIEADDQCQERFGIMVVPVK